jgi:hypothetical protein
VYSPENLLKGKSAELRKTFWQWACLSTHPVSHLILVLLLEAVFLAINYSSQDRPENRSKLNLSSGLTS